MGLCRGANLMLGISALSETPLDFWYICLIPIIYIGGITLIGREEVYGGKRSPLIFAAGLYAIVIMSIILLPAVITFDLIPTAPILIFLVFQIYRPLVTSIKSPNPDNIRLAVKAGVLSVIIFDASLLAGTMGILFGLGTLLLLPLSTRMGKVFAVT